MTINKNIKMGIQKSPLQELNEQLKEQQIALQKLKKNLSKKNK